MITRIRKWGNSLAIRYPQSLLSELNLEENDAVEINLVDNKLVLSPVKKTGREYTLEELVSQITPENQHELIDFGGPVGNEVW
jgi:antitoxin MazE